MDQHILACLPAKLKTALNGLESQLIHQLEEIRIRIDRPIELVAASKSFFLTERGLASELDQHALIASQEDGAKIMNLISRHSVYAIEEELRRGYITILGGHRVGITGRAVMEAGKIKLLKDIKSFNIRIAKEIKGVADPIISRLIRNKSFLSTLIISPPQCGKTTLLRDLIRLLSHGCLEPGVAGHKIGLVDERSEIASCLAGVPQNDLGPRVDVLDACPKAEGMMMLIRSMSPHIVASDEIGSEEDTAAILEAIYAGVSVLTTAHGLSLQEISKRPQLRGLFEQPVFDRYIVLSRRNGVGTIENILDGAGRSISKEKVGLEHA